MSDVQRAQDEKTVQTLPTVEAVEAELARTESQLSRHALHRNIAFALAACLCGGSAPLPLCVSRCFASTGNR
jgi:hypothetical protein